MPMPVPRCSLRSSPSLPRQFVRAFRASARGARFSCIRPPGRERESDTRPVAAGGRVAFKRQSTSKHRRSEDRDHHQRNHATHRWTGVDAQRPTAATEPRSELDGEDCGGQTEENNLPLSRGKSANRMLGAAGPRYFVFQAFGYLIASDSGRRFAVVDTNLSTRHMHHQGFITHDHDSLPTPPPPNWFGLRSEGLAFGSFGGEQERKGTMNRRSLLLTALTLAPPLVAGSCEFCLSGESKVHLAS